jgi:hypothetical protein
MLGVSGAVKCVRRRSGGKLFSQSAQALGGFFDGVENQFDANTHFSLG